MLTYQTTDYAYLSTKIVLILLKCCRGKIKIYERLKKGWLANMLRKILHQKCPVSTFKLFIIND